MTVALLPLLLPLLLLAGGGNRPASLPLVVSDSGTLLVRGSLAGRSAEMTIDTGAGVCRFPPSMLAAGKPAGTSPGTGRLGEPPLFDLHRVPELSVGEARWKDAPVASWPLLDEMHLSGMVSAALFARTPVTIALSLKALIFETKEGLAAREAAGIIVPVEIQRQGEASLLVIVPVEVDATKRRLVLDTAFPGALEIPGGGRHELALGSLRKKVSSASRTTPGADGRLGLGAFEGRSLTLDVPGARIIVSR